MVTLIVETLRRDGRVAERYRSGGERFSVGRAYDNDIILDDPFVCPRHAELYRDDAGFWRIRDYASVNGIWHRLRGWLAESERLDSGDEVTLGHTRLRLVEPDHEVATTRRYLPRPRWVGALDRPTVAAIAVAAAVALISYLALLASGQRMDWAERLAPALGALLIIAGWAGCWSGIGQLTQRRTAFAGHCSALALAMLALNGLQEVIGFAAFWSGAWLVTEVVAYVGGALLGAWLLYASLLLATRIRWFKALLVSQGVAWSLLGVIVVTHIANEPSFRSQPGYATELKPPAFAWRDGVAPAAFSRTVDSVFDELEAGDKSAPAAD